MRDSNENTGDRRNIPAPGTNTRDLLGRVFAGGSDGGIRTRDAHASNYRRRRWAVTKISRWHTIVIAARECRRIRFDLEAVISSVGGVHPRIFRSKTLQTIVVIILITDAHGFRNESRSTPWCAQPAEDRWNTQTNLRDVWLYYLNDKNHIFFSIFFEITVDISFQLFVETRFEISPDENFTARPSTDIFHFTEYSDPCIGPTVGLSLVNSMFPATVVLIRRENPSVKRINSFWRVYD